MAGEILIDGKVATADQLTALYASSGATQLPAGVLVGPAATQLAGASPLQNVQPGSLMRWRQALARSANGGTATVALLGDSTWMGAYGATSTAWRPNGPGKKLPVAMTARGFKMLPYNNFFGNGSVNSTGSFGVVDSRITTTGSVTTARGPSVGGYCAFCSTAAAGTLSFTFNGPVDSIDLWLLQTGVAAGTWAVDVDGTPTTPANVSTPQGTEAPSKQTVTTTVTGAGTHTLTLTRTAGQPGLIGLNCYQAAASGITVMQMGWGGSLISQWTATTPQYAAPLAFLTNPIGLQPDLCLVNNGINDALSIKNGLETLAGYTAKLDNIVKSLTGVTQVNGITGKSDVILRTMFPSDPSQSTQSIQDQVAQACRDVAIANGVPYIDQYRRYNGSWTKAQSYGLTGDNFHPSGDLGYWDMVSFDAAALAMSGA